MVLPIDLRSRLTLPLLLRGSRDAALLLVVSGALELSVMVSFGLSSGCLDAELKLWLDEPSSSPLCAGRPEAP